MKRKISPYLFFAFCFTLPLSQFLNSRILFVAVIIITFLSIEKFSFREFAHQSWDLFLFFFVLIAGLIYSIEIELGLRQLETSLSLIGVPLMIYLAGLSKEKMAYAFYAFAVGTFVSSMICIITAITSVFQTGKWGVFFYSQFSQPIDSHPTYFAYYLIFVITYGLYQSYYELTKRSTLLTISLIVFFFMILLLTGGQTAFISMLLIFSFFIIKYLLGEKSSKQTIVFFLIVILTMFMFSIIVVFQNNEEFLQLSNQNDYWERMTLWQSALKANDNLLLGVGTGDYKFVLNEYYRSHDLVKYANDNFNSHNQYIQIYFSNGLIGLFSLIILLARPLYFSVKTQNPLGILIFFPFIIYGITEVFLGRYQGVVFFAFLHQAFISYYYYSSPQYSLKVEKF